MKAPMTESQKKLREWKRARMHAILDETVAYYAEDPDGLRGTTALGCQYLTEDGQMCAVGRCMEAPHIDLGGEVDRLYDGRQNKQVPLDPLLKPEYRGLSLTFWAVLQGLHDNDGYWTDTAGLSDRGIAVRDKIREAINNGDYDDNNTD